jgi:hypothetical protein
MKKMVNFRLNEQIIGIISLLENKLHCSRTAVVEQALQFYAQKKMAEHENILKYAGVLSAQDANIMLSNIKDSRQNKDVSIEL